MWSGSQRANDSKSLQQEIVGLEAVAGAMRDDLDTMRRYQREAAYARTLQGRALLGLGHAFSVYCVFRVVLVSVLSSF